MEQFVSQLKDSENLTFNEKLNNLGGCSNKRLKIVENYK